ncbi:MAG TPA: hypothetical protein ENI87_00005, partial [bacterium]|nr:hypothetical protein [bacterium]
MPVQLESHATPFGGSPQQRYASLHRAIERGLDSDDVWCELARVCLQLGNRGEALHCLDGIRSHARRSRIEGEIRRAGKAAGQGPTDDATRAPSTPPTAAPAASDAGTGKARGQATRTAAVDDPGVGDHLLDAAQYLFHQHMPWLVLTTVLAFPLVVGVGGLLTAGSSPLLLTAIAALPGLCVLTVVAGMGHEILSHSSQGEGDVPELPEFGRLVRGARDFALDLVLIAGSFFGPPALLLVAGASWLSILPGLGISVLLAPLAFALRHVRRDLRAMSPVFLLRAVRRSGRGYPLVATATVLSFAPAVAIAMAVAAYPVWVQIALVGPL